MPRNRRQAQELTHAQGSHWTELEAVMPCVNIGNGGCHASFSTKGSLQLGDAHCKNNYYAHLAHVARLQRHDKRWAMKNAIHFSQPRFKGIRSKFKKR